jgi:hypothetical protein
VTTKCHTAALAALGSHLAFVFVEEFTTLVAFLSWFSTRLEQAIGADVGDDVLPANAGPPMMLARTATALTVAK